MRTTVFMVLEEGGTLETTVTREIERGLNAREDRLSSLHWFKKGEEEGVIAKMAERVIGLAETLARSI
jgi:flavin-binding protein dodecin